MGTPAVMDVIAKLEQVIIKHIMVRVTKAIKDGDIKECDPELTAFIVLKLYVSLIFDWEKDHKPLNKEEIAEIFESYILKGLSI